MQFIYANFFPILSVIVTFGLAVFVHEFGHMIFALMRGVGVESFAIGMGPKIFAWHWRGIEFSLRWLPIGGFVKLKGMMAEEPESSEAPPVATEEAAAQRSKTEGEESAVPAQKDEESSKSLGESSYDDMLALSNKGLLTKLLVFGGGVFMNFLAAICAMAFFLMIPKEEGRLLFNLYRVDSESPAAQAGFRADDRVVSVNGRSMRFMDEFDDYLGKPVSRGGAATGAGTTSLSFTVERDDQRLDLELPAMNAEELEKFLAGLEIVHPPIVGGTAPTAPADKAGIRENDRIIALNGKPIQTFNEITELIEGSKGRSISIAVRRGDEATSFTVTPRKGHLGENDWLIGIFPGTEYTRTIGGLSPWVAIARAPGETWGQLGWLIDQHIDFFRKASLRQVVDNVGGPIMIINITKRFADRGFQSALHWFVTLNLLLMVFNLLPIPVLDGGFILISIIEAVIRRPVPSRVLAPIYTVFVIFFIALIVSISVWDVKRWFF